MALAGSRLAARCPLARGSARQGRQQCRGRAAWPERRPVPACALVRGAAQAARQIVNFVARRSLVGLGRLRRKRKRNSHITWFLGSYF